MKRKRPDENPSDGTQEQLGGPQNKLEVEVFGPYANVVFSIVDDAVVPLIDSWYQENKDTADHLGDSAGEIERNLSLQSIEESEWVAESQPYGESQWRVAESQPYEESQPHEELQPSKEPRRVDEQLPDLDEEFVDDLDPEAEESSELEYDQETEEYIAGTASSVVDEALDEFLGGCIDAQGGTGQVGREELITQLKSHAAIMPLRDVAIEGAANQIRLILESTEITD